MLALIGRRLGGADELLDLGLVFDSVNVTRLAVPLGGSYALEPEAAEFGGEPGRLLTAGEMSFVCSAGAP